MGETNDAFADNIHAELDELEEEKHKSDAAATLHIQPTGKTSDTNQNNAEISDSQVRVIINSDSRPSRFVNEPFQRNVFATASTRSVRSTTSRTTFSRRIQVTNFSAPTFFSYRTQEVGHYLYFLNLLSCKNK